MGRLADFFREQSIGLAGQQKVKMLSLDREFEDMAAERDALKTENLHLKASVNPLKRDIERMQEQIQRAKAAAETRNEKLEEQAEALLVAIAKRFHISRDGGASIIGGSQPEAQYYLGLLKERRFIRYAFGNYRVDGRYEARRKAWHI
jgi:outer membrane murein-binding lipoprotein Lpp